jgi:hypothetical protein
MEFYFLHMKFDEVGTTFKHLETINGNVKNLSKSRELLLQEFNITIREHVGSA